MKKFFNDIKSSLKEIPKILKREYPYNKYGWDAHVYKNYTQITRIARLMRKSKVDLFTPCDLDYSVTQMTFAMFKDFFERDTEQWYRTEADWFKEYSTEWGMTKAYAKKESKRRVEAYKKIVMVYNYIIKIRDDNQKVLDDFQDVIFNHDDNARDWLNRKMVWHDFKFFVNKDYSVTLKVDKKVIDVSSKELIERFFGIENELVKLDNQVLHTIIDVMHWMNN